MDCTRFGIVKISECLFDGLLLGDVVCIECCYDFPAGLMKRIVESVSFSLTGISMKYLDPWIALREFLANFKGSVFRLILDDYHFQVFFGIVEPNKCI